jgi:Subtilase family
MIHECNVQTGILSSPSFGDCGTGKATAVPTVGSSLFGSPVYHGTGVTTIAGGLLQNGFGSAGTGGQVVVPMLYKVNLSTYAFHVGAAIQLAVDQGANIINISAGYPCRMLTNLGGWAPGICSPGDRASFCTLVTAGLTLAAAAICASAAAANAIPIIGSIIAVGLYAACAVATGAVIAASTACYATLLLGNVRSEMEAGVGYAIEHGVTVVASAGDLIDKSQLPPVIRDIVDADPAKSTVENWQVIPAAIPGVIAVGSTTNTRPYTNTHFHGNLVSTWAPEPSNYWAPIKVDNISSPLAQTSLNATSAAAPYISGLLADVEAINPSLNPKTPGLSSDQVQAIPAKLAVLLSSTAYSNAYLTSKGYTTDPLIRNLVNPLGLITQAAQGIIPDIAMLGYDTNLNFDDAELKGNDTKAMASKITGDAATGTIVTFPGTGATTSSIDDDDWFYWEAPSAPGLYGNGTVDLTTPSISPWGELLLNDDIKLPLATTSAGSEDTKRYQLPTLVSTPGGCSYGRVTGPPRVYLNVSGKYGAYWRDDNVYKPRISGEERIGDVPEPDRFDTPGGNDNPLSPNNNDTRNGATLLGSGAFPWQLDASNTRVAQISIPNLNFHTCRDKDWFQVQLPDESIRGRLTSPLQCPATNVAIEFAPGMNITVYQGSSVIANGSNTSGIFLWELKDLSKPLTFELEPTNPGEYIVYDLRIRYINGIDWQCFMNSVPRMPPRSWIDLLKDCIACEALLGSKTKLTLGASEQNLLAKRLGLTDAAGYLVNWRGAGPFRLVTRLTTGNLRSVKLMNLDGKFLADAHPIVLADRRKTLLLQQEHLPAGKYIVLFDGYAPQSTVDVILPRNAVYDHSPVAESFVGGREERHQP